MARPQRWRWRRSSTCCKILSNCLVQAPERGTGFQPVSSHAREQTRVENPCHVMSDPVRYRFTPLRAGRLMLDGGGMFGLVPKVVWGKTVPTDDRNRITLHHNCLLLRGADDSNANPI